MTLDQFKQFLLLEAAKAQQFRRLLTPDELRSSRAASELWNRPEPFVQQTLALYAQLFNQQSSIATAAPPVPADALAGLQMEVRMVMKWLGNIDQELTNLQQPTQ